MKHQIGYIICTLLGLKWMLAFFVTSSVLGNLTYYTESDVVYSFVMYNYRKCNKISHVKVYINLCFCTILSTSLALASYIGDSSKLCIANTKAKCVHYWFVSRKRFNAQNDFYYIVMKYCINNCGRD